MQFKGTENFKVSELEYSETAQKHKIDNTIPDELEGNAKRLLEFVQGIRDKWGSGLLITSGFRGDVLNKLMGGSKTSAHRKCNAVDLYPVNNKFEEFRVFMIEYLKDKNFDQCIEESSNNGKTKWIHFGLYNNSDRQRRQIFSLDI